jgi:hypothetical protein
MSLKNTNNPVHGHPPGKTIKRAETLEKGRKSKNDGWSGKKKEKIRFLAGFYSVAPGLLPIRRKW